MSELRGATAWRNYAKLVLVFVVAVATPGCSCDDRTPLASTPMSSLPIICGNGVTEPGEACDDGNEDDDGNGCSQSCYRMGSCGDGILQEIFEDCDDGNIVDDNNGCSPTCRRNDVCGDGIKQEIFEDCDDGNIIDDGNGCDGNCNANNICGNGIVEDAYEVCDDGFADDCGTCNSDCTAFGDGWTCGDGELCEQVEVCDAPLFTGCDASCQYFVANVYFAEDFDNPTFFVPGQAPGAGWEITDTNMPAEGTGGRPSPDPGQWVVGPFVSDAPNGHFHSDYDGGVYPPTFEGGAGGGSGNYLMSNTDGTGAYEPALDSGAALEAISPTFSTADSTVVWLHFDTAATPNNTGDSIFEVDVSVDGGSNWTNVWRRVSPHRNADDSIASGNFADTSNANGMHGRVHVDLTALAADAETVRLRFRHIEARDDYFFAIDNIAVDDHPAPTGGSEDILPLEPFDVGLPGSWNPQSSITCGGPCDPEDTWNGGDFGGRFVEGDIDPDTQMNRLEQPDAGGFVIIDSLHKPNGITPEDEILWTPVMDCSNYGQVWLHFESEILMGDEVIAEVVVSLDGGATYREHPAFVYSSSLNEFPLPALWEPYESPLYGTYVVPVPEAPGNAQVAIGFRWASTGAQGFWAIDNVKVTGTPPEL